MSQVSAGLSALGGIISGVFDGRVSLSDAGQRLGALAKTIGGQLTTDLGKVEAVLGPQASAEINAGVADIQQAAGSALTIVDADLAPYMAQAAAAVEGALDTVIDAAVPGGAALNPLVNGGIDAIANGLKAAIDAQATAWKAKLAANAAATPAVAAA